MRPKAIDLFEKLFVGSLAMGVANVMLLSPARRAGLPVLELATLGISLVLVLLVSRGRNNVFRWILTILTLGGIPFFIYYTIREGGIDASWAVSVLISALQLGALFQLFRPEANAWFARRGETVAAAE